MAVLVVSLRCAALDCGSSLAVDETRQQKASGAGVASFIDPAPLMSGRY